MATFYTGVDKQRYDAGEKFLPMNKFLASYTPPKTNLEAGVTTSYGIPNTNAFINSGGGGGGALQAGDINFDDFNRITTENYMRKQPTPLVDMNYNQRIQDKFFGMPTYQKQELTGPDLGEYIGGQETGYTPSGEQEFYYGTDVPLELTGAGKMKQGLQNTKEKVAAMMGKLPTLGNFLNKFGIQNFESLSPLDQQFIKQSSGYRGPTVFGENTSGLNKDPFGLNVESLFGNYAEAVRGDVDKLSGHLTKSAEKRGLTFDPVQGALVDAAGNVIDEEDYDKAMIDFMDMNKMNLSRFNFRTKQIEKQKQNELVHQQQKIDAANKAAMDKQQAQATSAADLQNIKNIQEYTGQGLSDYRMSRPESERQFTGHGKSGMGRDPEDKMATGGRVGLRYGGLLSIL
jgi:hypothetical protein